jgi:hypothetical protein
VVAQRSSIRKKSAAGLKVRRRILEIEQSARWNFARRFSHDEQHPLHVFADPSGHPFCSFVASVTIRAHCAASREGSDRT